MAATMVCSGALLGSPSGAEAARGLEVVAPPEVSPRALVGAWALDEGDGDVLHDRSGFGNNGAAKRKAGATGAITWKPGRTASTQSLYFDGSTYVSIPHSASLALEDGMSVAMWVYVETAGGDTHYNLLNKGGGGNNKPGYSMMLFSKTRPLVDLCEISGMTKQTDQTVSGSPIPAGSWHHLVCAWQSPETGGAPEIRFYIDGVALPGERRNNLPAVSAIGANSFYELRLGCSDVPDSFFRGQLSEVMLFNYGVSAADARRLYTTGGLPEVGDLRVSTDGGKLKLDWPDPAGAGDFIAVEVVVADTAGAVLETREVAAGTGTLTLTEIADPDSCTVSVRAVGAAGWKSPGAYIRPAASAGTPVAAPAFYRHNVDHWLYFGYENDYPKSYALMGGGLYPGIRGAAAQPILYTVTVGDTEYAPDEYAANRRQQIHWYQAEGYLNSPVSEWAAGGTGVTVSIHHQANRIANDTATAAFTQIMLSNTGVAQRQVYLNVSAAKNREVPLGGLAPVKEGDGFCVYEVTLPAGGTRTLEFVALASGTASLAQLKAAGSFADNFNAVKTRYDSAIAQQTHPVSLPDPEMVNSYKNSLIVMWETVVKSGGDYQIRGSGGKPDGSKNYDTVYPHDVPNMVEQFIRDGNLELAQRILSSGYYQKIPYEIYNLTIDAVPKYIIPYATLWQAMTPAQRVWFTDDVKAKIKAAAVELKTKYLTGTYGVMRRSMSLDNYENKERGGDYLLTDNLSALHGLSAYRYLCEGWGDAEEAAWAARELESLNTGFNKMLDETLARRGVDWYMADLEDDGGFWKRYRSGQTKYDGNFLMSSLMMSTFPWDAVLRGFDLRGTWADKFDASLDNAVALKRTRQSIIPEDSWGAWWGHEYGSVYNVGASIPLLFSDKYRTQPIIAYEWLLQNQGAPFQWGENFDKGQNAADWTKHAADYESWGLAFLRQGLLQSTASVTTAGDVIVGRGIPDRWMAVGQTIAWENIFINEGKKFSTLSFTRTDARTVTLTLTGDDAAGEIIFNLPLFAGRIESASVGVVDVEGGRVVCPGSTKSVTVILKEEEVIVTPPARLKGDVDGDGTVDSTDARLVLQHEVRLIELDEAQLTAADVSGEGAVDNTDARMILQYEVGLIRW